MSSASGGFAPDLHQGSAPGPAGGLLSQCPGFVPLRNKFLATPLTGEVKGNEMRGRAGRNRTEGAREEGREEGRKGRGPVKSVKPRAR